MAMAFAIIAIASSLWFPWTLLRAKASSAHSHSHDKISGQGLGPGIELGRKMARFSKVKKMEAALKAGNGYSKKIALN